MGCNDCHVITVKTTDIANGPGIRVSVWVAGCSHQCKGCHNPQTWKWTQGKELSQARIQKILDACDKPQIQGLTLTGGDPLFIKNREGVTELCRAFRERFGHTKDIWMWSGYLYKEVEGLEVFNFVDVLVEGKFMEELKDISLPYAGSSNQKVIQIRK